MTDMRDQQLNSNDKQQDDLRLLHLQFIGKIIAGFTHEIKNYLAIINESAGLMGDMLQMGKLSQQDIPEYLQIVHSVEDQITRTTDHIRYLNRYAHRMDTDLSSYNINESIEELVALLTRFANQKKIALENDFHNDIPSIYGNPSLFQFVVFSLLQEGLASLENDSKIAIQTSVADHSVQIKITFDGNVVQEESLQAVTPHKVIDTIIKRLQGSIKREQGRETLITLPLSIST